MKLIFVLSEFQSTYVNVHSYFPPLETNKHVHKLNQNMKGMDECALEADMHCCNKWARCRRRTQ